MKRHRELSPEDEKSLEQYESRARKLLETAQEFIREERHEEYHSMEFDREEVAVGADPSIYRGYYYPSPICDLLIGNWHRGKLLKRPNSRSRITNRYFFKGEDLVFVQQFYPAGTEIFSQEYLVRNQNSVVGIVISLHDGAIKQISEELYENDRLMECFVVGCDEDLNIEDYSKTTKPCRAKIETYYYDDHGIAECDFGDMQFGYFAYFGQDRYRFNRVDGYLESYYNVKNPDIVYTPGVKRLAMPPYFVK